MNKHKIWSFCTTDSCQFTCMQKRGHWRNYREGRVNPEPSNFSAGVHSFCSYVWLI